MRRCSVASPENVSKKSLLLTPPPQHRFFSCCACFSPLRPTPGYTRVSLGAGTGLLLSLQTSSAQRMRVSVARGAARFTQRTGTCGARVHGVTCTARAGLRAYVRTCVLLRGK
uniref:Uncharacterized protein n=1 Tax=Knipowitschia caucasica TaxID=637954 RepID=A0AAV2IWU3_KNICA